MVLTWLAFGCPAPAPAPAAAPTGAGAGVVAAFGLDERTVAAWEAKAGQQAQAVQEHVVGQGQVDLGQVQGDELYVETQRGTLWVATAIRVFARLCLWGAIAPQRDEKRVTPVVQHVRVRAKPG